MENTKKSGMSKGCLIGLIIAGVIIVIVVVAIVLMFVYKDAFVKAGISTITGEMKRLVAEVPPEGYDTAAVNTFTDAFTDKLNQDEQLDLQGLGLWMQRAQPLVSDNEISASDVEVLSEGMIQLYPDLEPLRPRAAVPEGETPEAVIPEGEQLEPTPEAETAE